MIVIVNKKRNVKISPKNENLAWTPVNTQVKKFIPYSKFTFTMKKANANRLSSSPKGEAGLKGRERDVVYLHEL